MRLEIAVQDLIGAVTARNRGADRVELCSSLELGGITPSAGLIESVVSGVEPEFPVHVLVRPRPGDFCYSPDDLDVMMEDVRRAVAAGAAGVVIGSLHRVKTGLVIDRVVLDLVVEAASGAEVTFHRAFDLVDDLTRAAEDLVDGGVHRVLTSGRAADAHSGIGEIAELVRVADGRIEVMAGGGVRVGELAELVHKRVDAIHLSAKRVRQVNGGYSLGAASAGSVMKWFETDGAVVERAAVELAELSGVARA